MAIPVGPMAVLDGPSFEGPLGTAWGRRKDRKEDGKEDSGSVTKFCQQSCSIASNRVNLIESEQNLDLNLSLAVVLHWSVCGGGYLTSPP